MKKYRISIVTFVFGTLVFVVAHFADVLTVKDMYFDTGSMLINISATFISISLLIFTYNLLGGEPIENLINYLINLQKVQDRIKKIGIDYIESSRHNIDIQQIHDDLAKSNEIFVLSRSMMNIKYDKVKQLYRNHVTKKNATVRIIICANSDFKAQLLALRDSVPIKHRNKFQIKEVENVNCSLYGSNQIVYVTPYLEHLSGDDSPSFVCSNYNESSLYNLYRNEFDHVWQNSAVSI